MRCRLSGVHSAMIVGAPVFEITLFLGCFVCVLLFEFVHVIAEDSSLKWMQNCPSSASARSLVGQRIFSVIF